MRCAIAIVAILPPRKGRCDEPVVPDGGSLRDEINHEAKRRLDAFLESVPVDRTSIQAHIAYGVPWKEITRMANHLSADLVAIGTVGRSGIRGVLLGNTAEKVLSTCDCSILTVKPDDFVSPIHPAYWPLHPGPHPVPPEVGTQGADPSRG